MCNLVLDLCGKAGQMHHVYAVVQARARALDLRPASGLPLLR